MVCYENRSSSNAKGALKGAAEGAVVGHVAAKHGVAAGTEPTRKTGSDLKNGLGHRWPCYIGLIW